MWRTTDRATMRGIPAKYVDDTVDSILWDAGCAVFAPPRCETGPAALRTPKAPAALYAGFRTCSVPRSRSGSQVEDELPERASHVVASCRHRGQPLADAAEPTPFPPACCARCRRLVGRVHQHLRPFLPEPPGGDFRLSARTGSFANHPGKTTAPSRGSFRRCRRGRCPSGANWAHA